MKIVSTPNTVAEEAFKLGKFRRFQLQYSQAKKYYEKAVSLAPENSIYLNNFGTFLLDLGQYKKAILIFEKALSIDKKTLGENHPDIAINLINLGLTYEFLHAYDKAMEFFQKASSIPAVHNSFYLWKKEKTYWKGLDYRLRQYEATYYHHYIEWLKYAQELGYVSVDIALPLLYAKYQSSRRLGQIFNVHSRTILRHLKRLNVPIRSRGGYNGKNKTKNI